MTDSAIWPSRYTICRADYPNDKEYYRDYSAAINHYGRWNKCLIDDGRGGNGWIFFEQLDDMRVWKSQK